MVDSVTYSTAEQTSQPQFPNPQPSNQIPVHTKTNLYLSNYNFTSFLEGTYYSVILFCDRYSLDKKKVAFGVFLTFLLFFFILATLIAWRKYSPIIEEFIIKENIEKARSKSEQKQKRRMNSFKKFMNKKKVQNHFKRSGEGVRLNSGQTSSQASIVTGREQGGQVDRIAAADVAAQAALKRMLANTENKQDAGKRRIQMIAKRELEEERKQLEGVTISEDRPSQDVREYEHSSVIAEVQYSCELLGDDVSKPKNELMKDLEEFLSLQVVSSDDDDDRIMASILMIYSLNKYQQRTTAVETICKYVQNILEHPGEDKFKSIRLGNKAFQERVACVTGGKQFLESVGFMEKDEGGEKFLVFSRDSDVHLVEALESLRNGQSVPIKVSRRLEIFSIEEGQKINTPHLSSDFFNLSADEIRAEQKNREQQVQQMMTLRTKEMRQKDEQLRNYKYKYTLIRIRIPGNIIIQGIFGCYEPFSAVRLFVSSVLSNSASSSEYSIRDSANQNVDDESQTLAELGLAPAAVLHLSFVKLPTESIISEEYTSIIQTFE